MIRLQTITKEELKRKLDEKEDVQIVNVLSPDYYHLGFIKDSKKIPVAELDEREKVLDKSKEVVVYCASHDCNASRQAAEKLAEKGYDVKAYEGGIKEWQAAGYPTESII